jgi:hypothetical protein
MSCLVASRGDCGFRGITDSSSVLMGNGSSAAVHGVGRVDLKLNSGKTLSLKNVQHVPGINRNLISGSLLCHDGFKLVFESNKFIVSRFGLFFGKGYDSGGLFRLSVIDGRNNMAKSISCSEMNVGEAAVWHSRLCHINFDCIIRLSKLNLILKIPIVRRSKCHACVQAKEPRKPFKSVEEKSLAPLDLIHSDLCEMNGILTRAGKKYFISFIDDATRYCQLYFVKTKDEALNYFKIYKAEVENQLESKIKRVRSDSGGEYLSNDFGEYCAEHGIIHEIIAPYLPQSNGVAERKNQSLTDLVNAMLDSLGLSKSWWGEAILATCFILNRVPSAKGDITPYEGWKGRKPALGFFACMRLFSQSKCTCMQEAKIGTKNR